jgi:ppGpp synthetase/RelA/SpoT-type nucleotidyltranferase
MEPNSTPRDIVDQFISRFRREFDFYEQAGRIVAQQLNAQLESSGIRAMVTSRAKNPKRLEVKIRQRDGERDYKNVEEIYADIVDLAGVRVALYFPGERDEVDKIIKENFRLTEVPKIFTGTSDPTDKKRFSGYWATHYRLQLREDALTEQSLRFADARVEVQVASVLTHAWSEVEHDLVYKPMQGMLSEDELAVLDELNGMMLVGEIALERLQRAAKARVSTAGAKFENHYDLASFLLELGKSRMPNSDKEPVVGDMETLFRLLRSLKISTPETLTPYLEGLTADNEQRPLAQQIIDQIVAAHPDRYAAYAAIRSDASKTESSEMISADSTIAESRHSAMGYFMTQWILFERFQREIAVARGFQPNMVKAPSPRLLKSLNILTDHELEEIERIRKIRNDLVHGFHTRPSVSLRGDGEVMSKILSRLQEDSDAEIVSAVERATAEPIKIENIYGNMLVSDLRYTGFELSKEAIELLKAAAEDEQGQILKLSFIGGRIVQAGVKQYGKDGARESSRWGAALNELLAQKLIEVRGHKGEVFSLTDAGWELAEKLAQDGKAD